MCKLSMCPTASSVRGTNLCCQVPEPSCIVSADHHFIIDHLPEAKQVRTSHA